MTKIVSAKTLKRKKFEALTEDIVEWLNDNSTKTITEKEGEIINCLQKVNLSSQDLMLFSAYLLIKFDQAKLVISQLQGFEPLWDLGCKTLRSTRRNASKPRSGVRSKHIRALQKIMGIYKRQGTTFKSFLSLIQEPTRPEMNIEIRKIGENQFEIRHENFDDFLRVKEITIKDWYSEAK